MRGSTPNPEVAFHLNVRDRVSFLSAIALALAGDARISLEGTSLPSRLHEIPSASNEESGKLRRNTYCPRLDFVILPLTPGTVHIILKELRSDDPGLDQLIHVQVEKAGLLQFGAYDEFAPNCVWCGPAVPVTLLDALRSKGILRSFVVPASDSGDD